MGSMGRPGTLEVSRRPLFSQIVVDEIYPGHYPPRKINIEPENDGLEDDFPFPGACSQVPC